MLTELYKWFPITIALIGGLFALYQIRSNNITNARLKWLDNLKQLISEFLGECNILTMKETLSTSISEIQKIQTLDQAQTSFHHRLLEDLIGHLKAIEAKYVLLKLNLNTKEQLHIKFDNLLEKYMDLLNVLPKTKKPEEIKEILVELRSYSETLIQLAKYITKLEWEKTKRSYFSKAVYFRYGRGKRLLDEALALKLAAKKYYI